MDSDPEIAKFDVVGITEDEAIDDITERRVTPGGMTSQRTAGIYSATFSSTRLILLNNKYKTKSRIEPTTGPVIKVDPDRHFLSPFRMVHEYNHRKCFNSDTPRFQTRSKISADLLADRPKQYKTGDHLSEARKCVNPRRHCNCKPQKLTPATDESRARSESGISVYEAVTPRPRAPKMVRFVSRK